MRIYGTPKDRKSDLQKAREITDYVKDKYLNYEINDFDYETQKLFERQYVDDDIDVKGTIIENTVFEAREDVDIHLTDGTVHHSLPIEVYANQGTCSLGAACIGYKAPEENPTPEQKALEATSKNGYSTANQSFVVRDSSTAYINTVHIREPHAITSIGYLDPRFNLSNANYAPGSLRGAAVYADVFIHHIYVPKHAIQATNITDKSWTFGSMSGNAFYNALCIDGIGTIEETYKTEKGGALDFIGETSAIIGLDFKVTGCGLDVMENNSGMYVQTIESGANYGLPRANYGFGLDFKMPQDVFGNKNIPEFIQFGLDILAISVDYGLVNELA